MTDKPWQAPITDDGFRSYSIGRAAQREQAVRAGLDAPVNDTERRWATEGPRDVPDLDTVRDWIAEDRR